MRRRYKLHVSYLLDNGEDSALFTTALACMSAFTSGDVAEAEQFRAIYNEREVTLSENPSFIQLFIIKGMRQMVLCSAQSRDQQHRTS